jgi:hypothetical protein
MGGRGATSPKGNREFSAGEKEAIEYYVSGDGMFLNNHLQKRDGADKIPLDSYDKKAIKNLDSATNRLIGKKTLYRSVDAQAIFGNMSDSEFDDLQSFLMNGESAMTNEARQKAKNKIDNAINKTITNKGYMSTTSKYEVARDWGGFSGSNKPIVLEIKTSGKTKGADVSYTDKNVAKGDEQYERLLKRNQKYKVKDISVKDGNIYVKVDM